MLCVGAFDGVLASSYNPAWDGTSSQRCQEPTFNITGPANLINARTAKFTWATNDSANPHPLPSADLAYNYQPKRAPNDGKSIQCHQLRPGKYVWATNDRALDLPFVFHGAIITTDQAPERAASGASNPRTLHRLLQCKLQPTQKRSGPGSMH